MQIAKYDGMNRCKNFTTDQGSSCSMRTLHENTHAYSSTQLPFTHKLFSSCGNLCIRANFRLSSFSVLISQIMSVICTMLPLIQLMITNWNLLYSSVLCRFSECGQSATPILVINMVGNVNWFTVSMMAWFPRNWAFVERMMVPEFLHHDYGVVSPEPRAYFKAATMPLVDTVTSTGWCTKYTSLCQKVWRRDQ